MEPGQPAQQPGGDTLFQHMLSVRERLGGGESYQIEAEPPGLDDDGPLEVQRFGSVDRGGNGKYGHSNPIARPPGAIRPPFALLPDGPCSGSGGPTPAPRGGTQPPGPRQKSEGRSPPGGDHSPARPGYA